MSSFLIGSATSQSVATEMSSRGWVDRVLDLIDIFNCESVGNRWLDGRPPLSEDKWK